MAVVLSATHGGTDDAELHHIFPRAYLATNNPDDEADVLANLALVTREDNLAMGARPPWEYLKELSDGRRKSFLSASFIPEDVADQSCDYADFIERRAQLLSERAHDLMTDAI